MKNINITLNLVNEEPDYVRVVRDENNAEVILTGWDAAVLRMMEIVDKYDKSILKGERI